jgi:hypothetical protein
MAESVQVRIGDTVRANFNMIFKRAEVARLRDPENFQVVGFELNCTTRAAIVVATGGTTATGPIRCRTQAILADDDPVEVDFVFQDDKLFRINDVWEMSFCYVGNPANFPPSGIPHPRKHLLGTAQLVS